MPRAFLLYTPIPSAEEDLFAGGPFFIKTGSLLAYVAFSSKELAAEFCEYWNIAGQVKIIPIELLGSKYPLSPTATRTGTVVLFDTPDTLKSYFQNREAFPCDEHFVPLSTFRPSWFRRAIQRLWP